MDPIILDFLRQLKENNNREWFQANKKMYDTAKLEMEAFVDNLIPMMAVFEPSIKFVSAKECMFRIFRDVRFSKDKSPYKTNMGAWITKGGRKSSGPGYYLHIQPGESMLAGGVYMPETDQLKKIRQEIYYNAEEFKAILENKNAKKYFTGLSDWDKQKLPPRDFPKDFPDIDLLKNRHYTVACMLSDNQVIEKDFSKLVVKVFGLMKPLNVFLERALNG
ncbi:MAG: DUF2461 domain-containing protein [Bacteroidetes bacterium]|nr:DUF2461 domain-containing protein [Bacteroidota bacterium]